MKTETGSSAFSSTDITNENSIYFHRLFFVTKARYRTVIIISHLRILNPFYTFRYVHLKARQFFHPWDLFSSFFFLWYIVWIDPRSGNAICSKVGFIRYSWSYINTTGVWDESSFGWGFRARYISSWTWEMEVIAPSSSLHHSRSQVIPVVVRQRCDISTKSTRHWENWSRVPWSVPHWPKRQVAPVLDGGGT